VLLLQDKYLHTNCLAALANMSSQFRSLHPYVSQRLVSLFETLAKKHSRLADQIQQQDSGGSAPVTVVNVEDTEQPSDLVRQGNKPLRTAYGLKFHIALQLYCVCQSRDSTCILFGYASVVTQNSACEVLVCEEI
jgi:hypothetical protein